MFITMKSYHFCLVVSLSIVFKASCEHTKTFYYTYTRNGTCVKAYYTEEEFYKIYCFEPLAEQNDALGIVTDKNDTIIYKGYGEISECFELSHANSTNKTSICLDLFPENCMHGQDDEKRRKVEDVPEIPCKKDSRFHYLGLRFDNLNLIFRCVIFSVRIPPADQNQVARYCSNRAIVNVSKAKDKGFSFQKIIKMFQNPEK
ncbi:uncharacterized protein LOC114349487 isoform X1 [Diabrotica virgifera virgifera]|uniref:Uncharacterized protein n=1 Tax=Diabrotica virgifera virgifera TaxID=50390 RepID=A0ABM5J0K6_DIAVI|nr:uncharacterized protein LOC114349487 isoform X1 [Diabrotica virgifera virgifera]